MSKRISKIFALVIAVALATAIVVGCGGSGEDPPTKAEYIKTAERICKKANDDEFRIFGEYAQKNKARMDKEPLPPKNVKTTTDIIRLIKAPTTEKELEDLEALTPPEGEEEKLQQIYTNTLANLEKLKKEPLLVWASEANDPMVPSFKEAQAYGFENCAEG